MKRLAIVLFGMALLGFGPPAGPANYDGIVLQIGVDNTPCDGVGNCAGNVAMGVTVTIPEVQGWNAFSAANGPPCFDRGGFLCVTEAQVCDGSLTTDLVNKRLAPEIEKGFLEWVMSPINQCGNTIGVPTDCWYITVDEIENEIGTSCNTDNDQPSVYRAKVTLRVQQ